MKKLFFILLPFLFAACGNNTTASGGPAPNPTNVQNVNGNIPDTSSGVTLNSNSTDSLRRDSATQK